MPKITPDQAMQIAQSFSGFARAVEDFRFNHMNDLTDIQESALRNAETSLRKTSDDFLDMGVNAVLDDAQGAIDGLGKVTTLLNKDLTTLTTINTALQIAGSLLQLATGFATMNPAGITSGIASTVGVLQSVAEPPKPPA